MAVAGRNASSSPGLSALLSSGAPGNSPAPLSSRPRLQSARSAIGHGRSANGRFGPGAGPSASPNTSWLARRRPRAESGPGVRPVGSQKPEVRIREESGSGKSQERKRDEGRGKRKERGGDRRPRQLRNRGSGCVRRRRCVGIECVLAGSETEGAPVRTRGSPARHSNPARVVGSSGRPGLIHRWQAAGRDGQRMRRRAGGKASEHRESGRQESRREQQSG